MWYALPQPVLDRTFDVWSPYNEQFYKEISHAVGTENNEELKYVLNKYQISYVLFDESVIQPGNDNSTENIKKQRDFLDSLPFISKVARFGKVSIYEFNLPNITSFISSPKVDYSSPFVSTGKVGDTVLKENFSSDQGYKDAKNCDQKLRGEVVKKKVGGGNYYMASEDGVSCDYFYYPTLDYSKAYQMRLTGLNISGRSLKFYLVNPKLNMIDMEEILPSGHFDKSYLIMPTESSSSAGLGYTLSVETRSFGNQKSKNWLTGIEFSPVEYNLVRPDTVFSNLIINNVQKYGTWGYKIDVQGYAVPAGRQGLIQLGQGYDPGWSGFTIQYLPPSSESWRFKILEHVKVNSWANGWLIGQSQSELVGVGSNFTNREADKFQPISTVYLIFWPQFLEWGGMILGVSAFLFLTLSKSRNLKRVGKDDSE